MLRLGIIPVILSLLMGILISFDPFIRNYLSGKDAGSIIAIIPYLMPLIGIVTTIISFILVSNFEKVWNKRIPILIILLIVSFQLTSITRIGKLDLNDVVIFFLAFIWFIDLLVKKDQAIAQSPLNYLVLLFSVFLILSCINGREVSMIRFFTTILKYLLTFILLLNLLNTKDRLFLFMRVSLIVTSISALIGIFQVILYITTGSLVIGNVDFKTLSLMFEDTSIGRLLRAPAFFGSPQKFAAALSITVVVALFYVVTPLLKGIKTRLVLVAAIVIMSLALFMTFARAAWAGVLAASLTIPYFRKVSYALHYTVILLAMVILLYFFGAWGFLYKEADREINQGNLGYRLELLKSAVKGVASRHSILGVGIDQGHKYHPNIFNWTVHNAFAMAAVETGIFGFLVYCLFFVILFARLLSLIIILKNENDKAVPKALIVGFVALIVYLQGDPSFHDLLNWLYFALIESTILIYRKENQVIRK